MAEAKTDKLLLDLVTYVDEVPDEVKEVIMKLPGAVKAERQRHTAELQMLKEGRQDGQSHDSAMDEHQEAAECFRLWAEVLNLKVELAAVANGGVARHEVEDMVRERETDKPDQPAQSLTTECTVKGEEMSENDVKAETPMSAPLTAMRRNIEYPAPLNRKRAGSQGTLSLPEGTPKRPKADTEGRRPRAAPRCGACVKWGLLCSRMAVTQGDGDKAVMGLYNLQSPELPQTFVEARDGLLVIWERERKAARIEIHNLSEAIATEQSGKRYTSLKSIATARQKEKDGVSACIKDLLLLTARGNDQEAKKLVRQLPGALKSQRDPDEAEIAVLRMELDELRRSAAATGSQAPNAAQNHVPPDGRPDIERQHMSAAGALPRPLEGFGREIDASLSRLPGVEPGLDEVKSARPSIMLDVMQRARLKSVNTTDFVVRFAHAQRAAYKTTPLRAFPRAAAMATQTVRTASDMRQTDLFATSKANVNDNGPNWSMENNDGTQVRLHIASEPLPRGTDDGPKVCLFWYHNNNCARAAEPRTDYTCDFRHKIDDPPQVIMPPPGFHHSRERCGMDLCFAEIERRQQDARTAASKSVNTRSPSPRLDESRAGHAMSLSSIDDESEKGARIHTSLKTHAALPPTAPAAARLPNNSMGGREFPLVKSVNCYQPASTNASTYRTPDRKTTNSTRDPRPEARLRECACQKQQEATLDRDGYVETSAKRKRIHQEQMPAVNKRQRTVTHQLQVSCTLLCGSCKHRGLPCNNQAWCGSRMTRNVMCVYHPCEARDACQKADCTRIHPNQWKDGDDAGNEFQVQGLNRPTMAPRSKAPPYLTGVHHR